MESSKKTLAKKATKKASKLSNRKSVKSLYSEKTKLRQTLRREIKHMNTRKLVRSKLLSKTRKIPTDFPYENHITLLIHGANTNATFKLPHNIEVVTFTLAGRPLRELTAFKVIDILRNKYDYYRNRKFDKIKSRFFSVSTWSKDIVKPQVYNNQNECPNYPIQFKVDYLSPVQKIFNPEIAEIEYSIADGKFKKFTTIEGILGKLTKDFYDTLPEVNGTRNSTLKNFVKFIKENIEGSVRIFYLGCAGGDVGPYLMEEEPERSLKNFSLNSPL